MSVLICISPLDSLKLPLVVELRPNTHQQTTDKFVWQTWGDLMMWARTEQLKQIWPLIQILKVFFLNEWAPSPNPPDLYLQKHLQGSKN